MAVMVRLEMDFGREPAARATEGLVLLPPCSGDEGMCSDHGATEHLDQICRAATLGQERRHILEDPGARGPKCSQTMFQFPNRSGKVRYEYRVR